MFSTHNMDHSIFSGSVHQETGISLGYFYSLVANRGYWVCNSFSGKMEGYGKFCHQQWGCYQDIPLSACDFWGHGPSNHCSMAPLSQAPMGIIAHSSASCGVGIRIEISNSCYWKESCSCNYETSYETSQAYKLSEKTNSHIFPLPD